MRAYDQPMTEKTAPHDASAIPASPAPLEADELRLIDAYWRAANYLSIGQIYLLDNPLLREPLTLDHVKPRLLGHWGTTPGLNFIYAHINRIVVRRDIAVLNVTGPGHGGPGIVANAYLEGTYSEYYPDIDQSEGGLCRLFKQFSFPGGIPSHAAPADARLHQRRRRTRLLALARVRRGVRQSESHRRLYDRRRRSRDGSARGELAFEQIFESRSADGAVLADPAPQRLQDREPDVLARISRMTNSSR